jgi:hypothetical protein
MRTPGRSILSIRSVFACLVVLASVAPAAAGYVNFEASHVHTLGLTPSGNRLLAVNTPDARLEVFLVQPDGSRVIDSSIPVGLEPVSVVARRDGEAWVVNQLSDSVSVVDLGDLRSAGPIQATDCLSAGRSYLCTRTREPGRLPGTATTTSLAGATRVVSATPAAGASRSTGWNASSRR